MDHGARPGVHALCILKDLLGTGSMFSFSSLFPDPEALIGKMATKKLFIQK